VAFDPPENPPPQPVHPAGATSIIINEANRQHLEQKQTFKAYHAVDHALRNQIIALLPDIYIRALKHATTGYGNVTTRTFLEHLWTNYGAITQAELNDNETRMQIPWNPPMPIEVLFTQLDNGIAYAAAGDETLSATQVPRIGYNIIDATRLFKLPCRDWRLKARADKTMQTFKTHFSRADVDRASGTTTGTAGFHGAANHVAATPPISEEVTQAQIIADTVTKQVALAMAALNVNANTNTRTNASRRPRPTAYCWTHGLSKNVRHTSSACNNRAEGHQETATKDNKMGGSDRVYGHRPEE
jgi:hypothetical protein